MENSNTQSGRVEGEPHWELASPSFKAAGFRGHKGDPSQFSEQQREGAKQGHRHPCLYSLGPKPEDTLINTVSSISQLHPGLTGRLDQYLFHRHGSDSPRNSTRLKAQL